MGESDPKSTPGSLGRCSRGRASSNGFGTLPTWSPGNTTEKFAPRTCAAFWLELSSSVAGRELSVVSDVYFFTVNLAVQVLDLAPCFFGLR